LVFLAQDGLAEFVIPLRCVLNIVPSLDHVSRPLASARSGFMGLKEKSVNRCCKLPRMLGRNDEARILNQSGCVTDICRNTRNSSRHSLSEYIGSAFAIGRAEHDDIQASEQTSDIGSFSKSENAISGRQPVSIPPY
jgi:hypothetical protein